MCGIIGQFGGEFNKERFLRARDTLEHRGPDDADLFYDASSGVALGHRRLSIIDLSSLGRQPMRSADGRYIITFNGEIFNFIELRRELSDYPFKSKTDTEVLLAAYAKWGLKCLGKLNGQFAFAIYDIKNKELFCARDHFGIKPFYYTVKGTNFLFASEIKALLALGVTPKASARAIFDYLRYGFYDHGDFTFFEGINRLLPGQYAIFKDGELTINTYYDLASLASSEGKYDHFKKEDAALLLKTIIADAIRLQFRSDVPVGLNLSSGLDSMSMLFFANTVMGEDLHLFSAALDDKDYDEAQYLDDLLNPNQKRFLHKSNLTIEKVWPLAGKLLTIQDEPYGGLSTIHYFNLYDETKIPGVKVLLEGQGMDEILGGYRYYRTAAGANVSQDMTKEGAPEVLNPDFLAQFSREPIKFPAPFRSPLLNAQYRDIRYTKIPRVLRFNDHISLAYSKELRVPYLDPRLVEFCFFLPEQFKIDGDRHKVLLRDAMENIVPDVNKNRPKFFFGAFQTEWLRNHFREPVFEILNSASFKSRPYWNYKQALDRAERFFRGEGNNSFFLWQWLNLEMWFRKFTPHLFWIITLGSEVLFIITLFNQVTAS